MTTAIQTPAISTALPERFMARIEGRVQHAWAMAPRTTFLWGWKCRLT
nr:hypothetical protein [Comamonas jiangduensis]